MSYEDDEFEAEVDEREDPDVEDADWNMDPAHDACPSCGKLIAEETVQCPHCGNYISKEDAPYPRSWWFVVGVIFLLILSALGWFWWR